MTGLETLMEFGRDHIKSIMKMVASWPSCMDETRLKQRKWLGPRHIPMELWYRPPPNSVVTKVPIFGFWYDTFRKRVGFRWFLVCNLQKNPQKIPIFFLAPAIVFRCFQASEQAPGHQIKCVRILRDGYDKQDKYLAKPSFLLRPIFFSIIPTFIISFLESTLVSRCSQFDKSIDRFDRISGSFKFCLLAKSLSKIIL